MKSFLIHLIGTTFLGILCSCSLPQKVEWGDFLAEVELKNISWAWGTSELQEKNNNFILTARSENGLSSDINSIKLSNGQLFELKVAPYIYDALFENNHEKRSSILKYRVSENKISWTKRFNSIIIPPDYIYSNDNNLSFIAVLLLSDYKPDQILVLNPQNGEIQKSFTLDNTSTSQLPWSVHMSNSFKFLITAELIQQMSLKQIYLIFKREQGSVRFKCTGSLSFPQEWQDGLRPDGIRINNDVAIISMSKGRRDRLVPSQKIIFFDLRNNSTILEYSFMSNDIIFDAAITADRKYVAFMISKSLKTFVRLYKIADGKRH